ncbi:MAG: YdeI/OmpD-associated family protein [Longimicrobiales bacterium]
MTGEVWDDPLMFAGQADFGAWLAEHHDTVDELWVGFYKKHTGKGGLQYKEAVDECLCWGWIDGIKKRIDDERYVHRMTPRTDRSKWSRVNVDRYAELEAAGQIAEPGRAAFARFDPEKHPPYSFETARKKLAPEYRQRFEAAAEAWAFFREQPPYYRKTAAFWVMSAKRESTRERRLGQLIECSAAGERLPQISSGTRKKKG